MGSNATSVTLTSTFSDASQIIGVSLLQFNNNPLSTMSNSSSVQLELHYPSSSPLSNSALASYEVYLHNIEPVHYYTTAVISGIVQCNSTDVPYDVTVTCHEGDVNITCQGLRSMYRYTCPVISKFPICTSRRAQGFAKVNDCAVTDFSANHTVCSCSYSDANDLSLAMAYKSELKPSGQSAGLSMFSDRRATLVAAQEAIQMPLIHRQEYSSSFQVDHTPFLSVFEDNSIPLVEISSVVLIFSSLFISFMAFGFYFAHFPERKANVLKYVGWKAVETSKEATKEEVSLSIFDLVLPTELQSGRIWYMRFWLLLLEHHDLVGLLYESSEDSVYFEHESDLLRLLRIMSAVMSIASTVTACAYLYFWDDGFCQTMSSRESCEEHKFSLFKIDRPCAWNDYHKFCHFDKIS